jgi:uncharacterized membrane protein YcaP (DUF421 family)
MNEWIEKTNTEGVVEFVRVNSEELIEVGKEAEKALNRITFTLEQLREMELFVLKNEAIQYLKDTDWYAIRFAEQSIQIPDDIIQKRQAARALLSN